MLKLNEIHFVGNVNQKAIIRKDGKILLIQYPEDRIKHPDSRAWKKFDMPGGRLNVDERADVGLKREVKEEVGLEIIVKGILATGIFKNLIGNNVYFVVYDCVLDGDDQKIKFNDGEAEIVQWVTPEEFFTLPIIYPEYQEVLKPVLI